MSTPAPVVTDDTLEGVARGDILRVTGQNFKKTACVASAPHNRLQHTLVLNFNRVRRAPSLQRGTHALKKGMT